MANIQYYIWAAVGKFGVEILSFLGNVLIARVLLPDDYGVMAMIAIFIGLANTLSDSGFNDCLIRKPDCDRTDIGTIATYNIVASLILYALMFFLAPWIAGFFHREELELVTKIVAIGVVLKAFTLSGFVQLNKELKFKKNSIINVTSSIVSIIGTYVLALCGAGYWALVFQPLLVALSNIIMLLVVDCWRPYFCFNWSRFKKMFSFSSNLLVSYLVTTVSTNIYGFIIGKFYTAEQLGYYNQAQKMQTVPTQGINNVVMTTSYPIITKQKDTNTRYRMYVSLFEKYVAIIAFVVFFLISLADVVFWAFFGEKWLPSSNLFKIFMLIALTYPMMTINSNILKINGKASVYRNLAFFRSGCQLVALFICAPFGLPTIITGQVLAAFVSVTGDMFWGGRVSGFLFKKQLLLWGNLIWKPVVAYMLGFLFSRMLNSLILSGLVCTCVYLFVYVLLCEVTKDSVYGDLKVRIVSILKKLIEKVYYKRMGDSE